MQSLGSQSGDLAIVTLPPACTQINRLDQEEYLPHFYHFNPKKPQTSFAHNKMFDSFDPVILQRIACKYGQTSLWTQFLCSKNIQ